MEDHNLNIYANTDTANEAFEKYTESLDKVVNHLEIALYTGYAIFALFGLMFLFLIVKSSTSCCKKRRFPNA